jgi:heterodisulfide reductase subunit C
MTLRIRKDGSAGSIARRVEEMTGVELGVCFQCRKCTCGCPVSAMTETTPSEIMRCLHLGAGEELLASDLVWVCASCETCSARCPMGIDVAKVIDALRALALERGTPAPAGKQPLFNRAFLKTVELFGRTYDLGMIAAYKLGSLKLMNDVEKFPAMLAKGKIALMPPRGTSRGAVRRIFARVRKTRGTGGGKK